MLHWLDQQQLEGLHMRKLQSLAQLGTVMGAPVEGMEEESESWLENSRFLWVNVGSGAGLV